MNAWRYPLDHLLRVQRAANDAARRATGMYERHCADTGAGTSEHGACTLTAARSCFT